MRLLCVETSSPHASVALFDSDLSVAIPIQSTGWERPDLRRSPMSFDSHSERLTVEVRHLLREAGWTVASVDAIAVGIGPGRFTGVRVGLTFAKTLGYVLGRPIHVADSLSILARPAVERHPRVISVVNAHRNMFYVAVYEARGGRGICVMEPSALSAPATLDLFDGTTVAVGDGHQILFNEPGSGARGFPMRDPAVVDFPLASTLGRMVLDNGGRTRKVDWNSVFPLYIRGSEAEEKLRAGLLKPVTRLEDST
jgi:tRNA threonylcarbamoyl adenosine modification protein YeaZ